MKYGNLYDRDYIHKSLRSNKDVGLNDCVVING